MAFTPFGFDVNIHTKLGDDPNVDNNLTADEIKALFDSPMVAFKQYINEVLIPALDSFSPESSMAAFVQSTRPEYSPCLWFRPAESGSYSINYIAPNGTVYAIAQDINNNSVTTAKIADNAVSSAKIADNAVTAAKIADGVVGTTKIADNAVTAAKIADGNVTSRKIADGAVSVAKIADGSVTTGKIANGSVSPAKLSKSYFVSNENMNLVWGVHYGTSLPPAGNPGRLFFKKV